MSNINEIKTCNAIADILGIKYKDLFILTSRPDQMNRTDRSIDALFKGSELDLAMEHTLIESYSDQILDNQHFMKFTNKIKDRLLGVLPLPGSYTVVIEPLALNSIKKIEEAQDSLVSWIVRKAPLLEIGSPRTAPRHMIKEQPPGLPFEVAIYRWPGKSGKLRFARSIPDNLDERIEARIERALRDKCPKLAEAKKERTITILILELNDIPLGETIKLSQSVVTKLKSTIDIIDLPDDVYLVRTEIPEEFEITCIKESNLYFPDIYGYEPFYYPDDLG